MKTTVNLKLALQAIVIAVGTRASVTPMGLFVGVGLGLLEVVGGMCVWGFRGLVSVLLPFVSG